MDEQQATGMLRGDEVMVRDGVVAKKGTRMGENKRGKRWKRVGAGVLVGIVVVMGWVWWMTSSAHVAGVVERMLEKAMGGKAMVGKAELDWGGLIVLEDVRLRLADVSRPEGQILTIPKVRIWYDRWAVLYGKVDIERVELVEPVLHLTENMGTGRLNLQSLFEEIGGRWAEKQQGSGGVKRTMSGGKLPAIMLEHGTLLFSRVVKGGNIEAVGEVEMTGALVAEEQGKKRYVFALREVGKKGKGQRAEVQAGENVGGNVRGVVMKGWCDLEASSFEVGVDHLSLERICREYLPTTWGKWWDKLSPGGKVSMVKVGFSAEKGLEAGMEFSDLGILLPVGKNGVRLSAERGRLGVRNGQLWVDELRGKVQGIEYGITGHIDDLSPGGKMQLRLDAKGQIPGESGLVEFFPEAVKQGLWQLRPEGKFELKVMLERDGQSAEMWTRGGLLLEDVSLHDRKFEYPARNLQGDVRFEGNRIRIEQLTGLGSGETTLEMRGQVGLQAGVKTDVTIAARKVRMDGPVMKLLEPAERQWLGFFIDPENAKGLRERGLLKAIRAEGDHGGTNGGMNGGSNGGTPGLAMGFEPGGMMDMEMRVTHGEEGLKKEMTAYPKGMKVVCRYWPYPLMCMGGKVVVVDHRVVLDGITFLGLGGGKATLEGGMMPAMGHGNRLELEVKVTGQGLDVDEYLMASLPVEGEKWVRALKVGGKVDGQARLYSDEEGKLRFTIETGLKGASLQPGGSGPVIRPVDVKLRIEPEYLRIEKLLAKAGEGSLALEGKVDWGSGSKKAGEAGSGVETEFKAQAMGWKLDWNLVNFLSREGLFDEKTRVFIGEYKPTGVLDAKLEYAHGRNGVMSYAMKAKPEVLGLELARGPVVLTQMDGEIELTSKQVVFENVTGKLGVGQFRVDGKIGPAEKEKEAMEGALRIQMAGPHIDGMTRNALPGAVRDVVVGLNLQGGYLVHDAELKWETGMKDGSREKMDFSGVVDLEDTSVQVGVPVSDMVGQMEIKTQRRGREGRQQIDVKTKVAEMRILGRLVEQLQGQVVTAEGSDVLEIRGLEGSCYGGRIVGQGQMMTGKEGWYRIKLSMTDAALAPMVNPQAYWGEEDKKRWNATSSATTRKAEGKVEEESGPSGILSAGLTIEGSMVDETKRRGRGELAIRDARLYELPVAMTMLQLINLSWPGSKSFDRAEAEYLLEGDMVYLENILFDAKYVQMAGGGSMRYSTRELMLDMYSRNPRGPALGPVTEAVDLVKDSLVSIRVTGTLEKPAAKVQSLSGVKRSWEEIFGAGRRKRGEAAKSGQ